MVRIWDSNRISFISLYRLSTILLVMPNRSQAAQKTAEPLEATPLRIARQLSDCGSNLGPWGPCNQGWGIK
jgi:hypothetical protein